MGVLNFRGSPGFVSIINRAQGGDAGNASAAIRALMLLGADRLGYDLSTLQHEIIMLMMEPIDPAVIEELRLLLGDGIPHSLPQRPARGRTTRVVPTPRHRTERPDAAPTGTVYHTTWPATITETPPADLAATPGIYDIGEEI
jgi:hypothetical protein